MKTEIKEESWRFPASFFYFFTGATPSTVVLSYSDPENQLPARERCPAQRPARRAE
jgi:hypothetical protein